MLRFALAAALFALVTPASAEFQLYPGARLDPGLQQAIDEAGEEEGLADLMDGELTVFVTEDPFEDVLAFYRRLGREYELPTMPGLLGSGYERDLPAEIRYGASGVEIVPSGIKVKQAYVVMDDASDIDETQDWVTIVRPLVLSTDLEAGPQGQRYTYGEVLDITAILRAQTR